MFLGCVASDNPNDKSKTTGTQSYAEALPAPPIVGPTVDVYKPSCEQPKTHDDAAFCEERKSADSGREAAKWAKDQVWASLAGIAVVALTLFFTARAANAAMKAAEVAERALTDAERPYLIANMPKSGISKGAFEDPWMFGHSEISFTNHGRTPAILDSYYIEYALGVDPPPPIDCEGATRGKAISPPNEVIGAGKTCDPFSRLPIISKPPIDLMRGTWWAVGYVHYHDMLDVKYVTGFAFVLDADNNFGIAHPMGEGHRYNYTRKALAPRPTVIARLKGLIGFVPS